MTAQNHTFEQTFERVSHKLSKLAQEVIKTVGISVPLPDRVDYEPLKIDRSEQIAPLIDHTLLAPDATQSQIEKHCQEALQHGFATVCLNSYNVLHASKLLTDSSVKPICVVGFPLGAMLAQTKAHEAELAIHNGAKEIDTVINIAALKDRKTRDVFSDIQSVVKVAGKLPVKVILETCLLTEDEKILGALISKAAGAQFVKTSTGFSVGGATAGDILLLRVVVGPQLGVKASGGVRSYKDAMTMIAAGANRLGTSAGAQIIKGGASTAHY